MAEANAFIEKQIDRDPSVRSVDVATPMLDPDGRPRRELFLGDRPASERRRLLLLGQNREGQILGQLRAAVAVDP